MYTFELIIGSSFFDSWDAWQRKSITRSVLANSGGSGWMAGEGSDEAGLSRCFHDFLHPLGNIEVLMVDQLIKLTYDHVDQHLPLDLQICKIRDLLIQTQPSSFPIPSMQTHLRLANIRRGLANHVLCSKAWLLQIGGTLLFEESVLCRVRLVLPFDDDPIAMQDLSWVWNQVQFQFQSFETNRSPGIPATRHCLRVHCECRCLSSCDEWFKFKWFKRHAFPVFPIP